MAESPSTVQRSVAAWAALTLAAAIVGRGWSIRDTEQVEIDDASRRPLEFQVDLNAADWPEISLLPGIGETLARRLIESRRADGPFQSAKDLRRVRGVGEKTIERLRPHLVFETESPGQMSNSPHVNSPGR